jgi:hypothetical protein
MNTDQLPLFAAQAPPPASPSRPARKLRAAWRADAAAPAPPGAPPLDASTAPPDTVATSARTVTATAGQPPFLSVALELPLELPQTTSPVTSTATPTAAMTTPSLPDAAPDAAQALSSPPQPDVLAIRSDRLWQLDGWTARVIKNEDDDGWAVEMLQDGEAEPALVGPWTMGRDKKNPKPLDQAAFNTLVKTASEVLQRHRQQAHAMLHKRLTVFALDAQWDVRLDITPDEYEPYATLSAFDELGEEVAQVRVPPDFRLGVASATAWISGGFARPAQASRGFEGWSE